MDTMENRERAFEAHFVFNEEMAFTVATYRNRLLGLWAGEQMGLTGGALDGYAQDVVHQSLSPQSALDPVERVARDLMAKGVASSLDEVREKFEACAMSAAARLAA
eukprot:gene11418-11506_t